MEWIGFLIECEIEYIELEELELNFDVMLKLSQSQDWENQTIVC